MADDLGDLLPGFLEELGDYELLADALGATELSASPLSRAEGVASGRSSPPRRAPMQNSTRRRQKQELAYLRARVAELEAELAGLKAQLMRSSSGSSGAKDGANGADGEEKEGCQRRSWEKIAKRQLVEKQRAELRNLKLREMLESQIKVARSLERVLRKRPSAMDALEELEADAGDGWSKRLRALDASEDELYESLLSRTDAVYAELDAVCARHPGMRVLAEANDSEVLLGERDRLHMEVTSSKIVPFGLQATARAVWRCLSLNRVKLADGTYYKVDGSDDSVAAKAVMQLRIGESLALMRMRFVMKKFEEDGRVVLACVSASESEGPRDLLHGLRMMERVWVVIRPMDGSDNGSSSSSSSSSTIVQLCMRMTPTISSELGPRDQPPPDHAGALTDLMLSALHRNLGWLFQTVENLLMEEAVSQP